MPPDGVRSVLIMWKTMELTELVPDAGVMVWQVRYNIFRASGSLQINLLSHSTLMRHPPGSLPCVVVPSKEMSDFERKVRRTSMETCTLMNQRRMI